MALYYELLDLKEVIKKIKEKPENVEVVITGRKAPQEIIEIADLVTEMREVKHPYQKGVEARKGIEF
jgi:cob(I)alamin adenosyltransferase